MKIIAEVKKQGNESAAALIRRFTKRVQGTQALSRVREERYFERKIMICVSHLHALFRRSFRASSGDRILWSSPW
jgi:ribosomal protein S21